MADNAVRERRRLEQLGANKVRRIFAALPPPQRQAAQKQAAVEAALFLQRPATDAAGAADDPVLFLAQFWAEDKEMAEDFVATAVAAFKAEPPATREAPAERTGDELAELLEKRENKGRVTYNVLGPTVKLPLNTFALPFLYPHLWGVPVPDRSPAQAQQAWHDALRDHLSMVAKFENPALHLRLSSTMSGIKAWILLAHAALETMASHTTDIDRLWGLLPEPVFTIGWALFLALAEMTAISLKKQTSDFATKLNATLGTVQLFQWHMLFEKLPDYRPTGATPQSTQPKRYIFRPK